MDDETDWLTVPEAARRLGVTPTAIRNRIKRGTLDSKPQGNRGVLVRLPSPVPKPFGKPFQKDELVEELVTLRERLTERDQQIAELQHRIGWHEGTETELRARLADLQAERERLDAAHTAEIKRLQHTLDQLTAPWWRRWFSR